MATALWIAAGGAAGTLARYGMAGLINQSNHPWGTVAVNILGSTALGFLIGLWRFEHPADRHLAVTIGLLGGFTTFSTFALDTILVWEGGQPVLAMVSVAVSVIGSLAGAVVGLMVGRALGA